MTVVVAGVIERDGRVLVCRRRPQDAHPRKWEFPGGKVEPGEAPWEALARELHEELAIRVHAGREIERYEFRYPGKTPILLIFFSVSGFSGEPQNVVFETIAWAEPADLTAYDFLEGDIDFVGRLAEKKLLR
ncbi:MAG TPA: (deoxy)nucleoside triphosphate pyrophosphohydrolase [Bryobacteraceae bacterium]|nr:(deoxy)nucleoside triphosphate pyrophosphohydrolase [Bryobacteraceae bacterium]